MATTNHFTGLDKTKSIDFPNSIMNSGGAKLLFANDIEWGSFTINSVTINSTDALLDYIASLEGKITDGFDVNNACLFKGTYTASATSNASAAGGTFSTALTGHSKGWMYIVSGNGYFYNEKVEAGDLIICGEDSTTLTKANFYLILKNIDPSTYVTLAGEQTITGAKTFNSLTVTGNAVFNSPISGDLLGNATTATKLQSTATVGSSTVPVYFSGGLPIACGLQTVNGASFAVNGDNTAVTMTLTRANSGSSITGNIPVFGGANASTNGTPGLVKAPTTADVSKYLRGDGTWATVSTTDEKLKTVAAADNTVYYITAKATAANTSTGVTSTLVYLKDGKVYSNNSEVLNLADTQTISGNKTFSSNVSIDTLTAGSLTVTGNTTLTGATSANTITATSYNGYVLAAACAKAVTDSSSASAISTGTSLVTERDVYYGLPTINNSHAYTSSTTIYAPTAGGTAGYVLVSSGSTSAPTWKNFSEVNRTETTVYFDGASGHKDKLNSSKWVESGITVRTLTVGAWVIFITDSTTGAVFSGIFSVKNSSTAISTDLDEIPMHMNAGSTGISRIYAATQNGNLVISSLDAADTPHTLVIKYKLILN